ncbi:MAG: C1 family peptidase, partial [Myxococcota bacterium]|nr:C1 family peptidase [Myxococcota bacterium]
MDHKKERHARVQILLLCLSPLCLLSCDEINAALSQFLAPDAPRALSGDDAFRHISPRRDSAPTDEIEVVQAALEAELSGVGDQKSGEEDNPAVVELLRQVTYDRQQIDEDAFQRIDFDGYLAMMDAQPKADCSFDLDLSALEDEYQIPQVEKLPARDQGSRGTCAAFAGVATIEYALLNPEGGPLRALETLDLSEQRFYSNSKPDCLDASCGLDQEGSFYESGFQASLMSDGLDLPLEQDCPYQSSPERGNDTQTPLGGRCNQGAIRATESDVWCGLDGLVELLHQGYAVPFASPLSGNWEKNNGFISLGDFEGSGDTVHAGGHAYLIVGYKKLPDMPEEGGACFWVKNSWGPGWGINGYACMTVAWMKRVNFPEFIQYEYLVPVAFEVDEALKSALPEGDPSEDAPVDPNMPESEPDEALEPPVPPEEGDFNPSEEEVPLLEPDPARWEAKKLLGARRRYYRAETQPLGENLALRVTYRGGEQSQTLQVEQRGAALFHKGDQVGKLSTDELQLCSGPWAHFCSLRYQAEGRKISIEFRDPDLRR